MNLLHGNQDCDDHGNYDKMLQRPKSGAGQLCVLFVTSSGMLVLQCMMQLSTPAFNQL